MKPTTQRRLFLGGALVIGASALGVVAFADIGENLVYYWTPSEMAQNADKAVGADIRLGGLVKAGTLDWQADRNQLTFVVTDGQSEVTVHSTGAPPQMFRENIGVVVEGTLTAAGDFTSDRLMVKHSNEYRAPESGVASENLYNTVEGL